MQLCLWICPTVQCDPEERVPAHTATQLYDNLPVEYHLDTHSSSSSKSLQCLIIETVKIRSD
jgi:hypothetical protein